jgi:hypothetical protein
MCRSKGLFRYTVRLKVQNRAKLRNTEPHFVKIAKKNGDIFFAIFSKKGAKNETADDGGGCMSPRPTVKSGVAKNGELFGPKVKGQMKYSKANI